MHGLPPCIASTLELCYVIVLRSQGHDPAMVIAIELMEMVPFTAVGRCLFKANTPRPLVLEQEVPCACLGYHALNWGK